MNRHGNWCFSRPPAHQCHPTYLSAGPTKGDGYVRSKGSPYATPILENGSRGRRLAALPQLIPATALGKQGAVAPSERIVLGGIGIGNRGGYDLGCFLNEPDVQFVAVCDVKAARRKAVKEMADAKYGNRDCATYRDLRELLARSDIDAVLIATGPNWHATAAILAMKAGKDVYCEKPCTKNIAQSLALAETYRRTARVFQAGTQRRNLPHFAFAVELARSGKARQVADRLRPSLRNGKVWGFKAFFTWITSPRAQNWPRSDCRMTRFIDEAT